MSTELLDDNEGEGVSVVRFIKGGGGTALQITQDAFWVRIDSPAVALKLAKVLREWARTEKRA